MTTEQATARAFEIARLYDQRAVERSAGVLSLAILAGHPNPKVGALCKRLADRLQADGPVLIDADAAREFAR